MDDLNPAKCFDTMTGQMVHSFDFMRKSCFTLDVSTDLSIVCLGDINGRFMMGDYHTNLMSEHKP